MPAKIFLYQPYRHRPIFIHQVICKPYRTFIDNRSRLAHRLQIIKDPQIRLTGILQHIPLVSHQHDKTFRRNPLLKGIDFSDSGCIRGITANPPNRIRGIKYKPAGLQHSETAFYIFFKFHNKLQPRDTNTHFSAAGRPQIYPNSGKMPAMY